MLLRNARLSLITPIITERERGELYSRRNVREATATTTKGIITRKKRESRRVPLYTAKEPLYSLYSYNRLLNKITTTESFFSPIKTTYYDYSVINGSFLTHLARIVANVHMCKSLILEYACTRTMSVLSLGLAIIIESHYQV
jgi:hypothetical protein